MVRSTVDSDTRTPASFGQHLLGRFRKARQRTGQGRQLPGRRRQLGLIHLQGRIGRRRPVPTMPAEVIRPFVADLADRTHDPPGLEALEPRRPVAVRAGDAAPEVALFLRPASALSMALAPIAWTRSRSSNSVRP